MILSFTEAKMAQTSLLQVRIDTELKQAAEELFTGIGLDTSSAVRLFFYASGRPSGDTVSAYPPGERHGGKGSRIESMARADSRHENPHSYRRRF
jgi:hypothetical protein